MRYDRLLHITAEESHYAHSQMLALLEAPTLYREAHLDYSTGLPVIRVRFFLPIIAKVFCRVNAP
ncbi:Uncharacterised protein [Vibrio cholerae]|nr:Uncharacterised protein [Vibrio cholerae]